VKARKKMTGEVSVPGFFRKREMLDGNRASKEDLGGEGKRLVAEGFLDEALLFFAKAEDGEGMASVLEESRRRGDAFTFEAALRATGRTASREEWAEVGERAAAAGQYRFAWRAFEKAGDQEGLKKVRLALAADGDAPIS
jgi:hypothetical protein